MQLISQLDGLPLALTTAGAYLNQVSTTLQDYLVYYNNSWLRLLKTTPNLPSYEDRTLYTTWNLSLEHIKSQNQLSVKLLQLWAHFDNHDLWFELVAAGKEGSPGWYAEMTNDELTFNDAIRPLCNHALVQSLKVGGGYSMHSCVHAWTIHVLNPTTDTSISKLAMTCVSGVLAESEFCSLTTERRLLPHALRSFASIQQSRGLESQQDLAVLVALSRMGRCFLDCLKFGEAETAFSQALEGFEKLYGPGHFQTLLAACGLATFSLGRSKYDEAAALFLRVSEGYEKLYGPEDQMTLAVVLHLGMAYRGKGRLAEAEPIFRRLIKTCVNKHDSLDVVLPEAATKLPDLYMEQENMQRADAMLQRGIGDSETLCCPDYLITLEAINLLGSLKEDQGQMKGAEAILKRVAEYCKKMPGPEKYLLLNPLRSLAGVYVKRGKVQEAKIIYQEALDVCRKAYGEDHPDTQHDMERMESVRNLIQIFISEGDARHPWRVYLANQAWEQGRERVKIALHCIATK